MPLITKDRLLEAAEFVRDNAAMLRLVARLTGNTVDDWLVDLLVRIAEKPEVIDEVTAWLNWTGIVGAGDRVAGERPALPAGFSDHASSLHALQSRLFLTADG